MTDTDDWYYTSFDQIYMNLQFKNSNSKVEFQCVTSSIMEGKVKVRSDKNVAPFCVSLREREKERAQVWRGLLSSLWLFINIWWVQYDL